MRLVALEREVLVLELEQLAARGVEAHAGESARRAGELLASLIEAIQIKMRVPQREDEFAALVGPFVPDRDAALLEPFHVGVAAQEPQQLVDDGFEVQLFRRQEREALVQREAQLPAEQRERAGAGAVGLARAMVEHLRQQIEVVALAHSVIEPTRSDALWKRSFGSLASILSRSGWCAAGVSGRRGTGAMRCMRMRSTGPADSEMR